MITKETKSIPATSIEVTKILCDECGEKAYTKCTECNADICTKHRWYHPEDSGGDYTQWICDSCLKIINEFAPTIAEYERELEEACEERKLACIKKRKAKNETNKT